MRDCIYFKDCDYLSPTARLGGICWLTQNKRLFKIKANEMNMKEKSYGDHSMSVWESVWIRNKFWDLICWCFLFQLLFAFCNLTEFPTTRTILTHKNLGDEGMMRNHWDNTLTSEHNPITVMSLNKISGAGFVRP